jgi:hypothetical protein
MPNGNTFTGFNTSTVVGPFTNGYYFKKNSSDSIGTFFPASGYIDSSGLLYNVGSIGSIWLSAAKSVNHAYHLEFSDGFVFK